MARMSLGSSESSYWRWSLARRLLSVLLIGIGSGFLGEIYVEIFYSEEAADTYLGFKTGFTIGAISALIEIFYIRSVRRSWIRRVAFLPGLLVRILALTVIVRVSLRGNEFLTQWLTNQPIGPQATFAEEIRDTLFSMLIVIVFVVLSQLSTVIGWRRFTNLVVGRYFKPVTEQRIFLLIDLIDSTALARRIGNIRFHEYLSEFFHQLDRAIVTTGGEIVSYIGDAVIVTWPLTSDVRKNSRSLLALARMRRQLKRQSKYFKSEFGEVPRFRAVLHCGEVVVGECGDSRRQITFLGDVLNMVGRMESFAKERDVEYLASNAIAQQLQASSGMTFENLGMQEIKGVAERQEFFSIHMSGGAEVTKSSSRAARMQNV